MATVEAGEPLDNPDKTWRPSMWPWGVILSVLAILLLVSSSRSIMLQETQAVFEPPDQLSAILSSMGAQVDLARRSKPMGARLDRIAAANPTYQIQFACAMSQASAADRIGRLRAMEARFPNEPSLYAALLVSRTIGEVRVNRREDDLFTGGSNYRSPYPSPPPSTAADLTAFDADAARGEALEPENGFFPFVRSIGLIAQHRDNDAIAAVERAASKPEWKEHFVDQAHSEIQLHSEYFHDDSALEHWVIGASMLYSHYAGLRAVARVLTYEAVEAEHSGDVKRGVAIRMALMQCGGLMRARSSPAIGTLVGIAITGVAESRPGGGPVVKKPENVTDDAWAKHKRNAFLAFLRKEGYDPDAVWAEKEFAAGDQARKIVNGATKGGRPIKPFVDYSEAQLAGMVLLADFIWFAAIAAVAFPFARLRRQWPAAIAILAIPFIALVAAALNMSQWGEAYKDIWLIFMDLTGSTYMGGMPLLLAKYAIPVVTLAIPCVWAMIVFASGRAKAHGPATEIAGSAPIAGMVLLILYGLLMAPSVTDIKRSNYAVEQTIEHEGAYDARQLGLAWPGPTSPQR